MEVSAVVPVFNEIESIEAFHQEITKAFDDLGKDYEIIYINDGSDDGSPAILDQYRDAEGSRTRVIHLKTRSGQSHALKTGIEAAKGTYIVTLDADLQNDPADIKYMFSEMEKGYDMVCGWRKNRQDKALKAFFSKLGNFLQRLFTRTKIHDVSCTLRVFKREVAGVIDLSWEGAHRFIPLFLIKKGYKVGEIVSNHRVRKFGTTKYTHKRLPKVVSDFFKILSS